MPACLHLDTGCISSMAQRIRPWSRITAAHSPKTNEKTLRIGHVSSSCRSHLESVVAFIISCSRKKEKESSKSTNAVLLYSLHSVLLPTFPRSYVTLLMRGF